jgi:hypothetical protein
LLYDGGWDHVAGAILHVEMQDRDRGSLHAAPAQRSPAPQLKQFGDIFTDAVALLAARKQRDWSGSALAPLVSIWGTMIGEARSHRAVIYASERKCHVR